MTYSYNYAVMMGREILQERRREADRERLIRQVSGWNPPFYQKLGILLQSRWEGMKKNQTGSSRTGAAPLPESTAS